MKKYIISFLGTLIIVSFILLINAPVFAALPVFSIPQGGTGTSTLPAYGKVLVGNRTGTGYDYVATSTFGGGGSSFSGPVNSIVTTDGSGALIATGTQLSFGNFLATSTTATSQIGGALFNGVPAVAGLGTTNYQLQISRNTNNIDGQVYLANTNMGANAVASLTFGNGNSTNAGASSAYIGGVVFCGPNFATAGFSGCPPNGLAMYNTDGGVAIGAISSNAASSSITFYSGNNSSFAGGSPDMVLTGGTARLGIGTTSPYTKLAVSGTVVADSFSATSTIATSTIAAAGLQIGPTKYDTSGYDNLLTLVPKRTFGSSGNAVFKEGVLDIDSTLSGRIALNIVQQSTAGTGSSPEMVNIQQQSTSATGIMVKVETAATGAAGNLLWSGKGQNCPAMESKELTWGTNSYWQWCSHQTDLLWDNRNNADSAYVPTVSVTSPFSSTTPQRFTLFPGDFAVANGNWTDGTGTFNVFGTSTNATMMNLTSLRGATEGDLFTVKQAGNVGVSSSTPWGLLSVNPNALGSGVPEFVVGSSTKTHLVVTGGGNVGIGNSAPINPLDITLPAVGTNSYVRLGSATASSFNTRFGTTASNQYAWFTNVYYTGAAFAKDDGTKGAWRMNQVVGTTDVTSSFGIDYFPVGSVTNTNVFTILGTATGGNIGIATGTPWRTLSVVGTAAINGLSSATSKNSVCIDATTKELVDAGSTTCISSSKYLKNITGTITPEVADYIVNRMKGITFDYKNSTNEQHYGFIAEDVAQIDHDVEAKFGVDAKVALYANEDITDKDTGHLFKKGDPIAVDYQMYTAVLTVYLQNHQSGKEQKSSTNPLSYEIMGIVIIYIVYNEWDKRSRPTSR